MSTQSKKTTQTNFNIIPSILFSVSAFIYLLGTLLPWLANDYVSQNIYNIVNITNILNKTPNSLTNQFTFSVLVVTITLLILAILQISNCFLKRKWLNKLSGIIGLIVNAIPWLTFLSSILFLGSASIGTYISAVGSVSVAISSLTLLIINPTKQR